MHLCSVMKCTLTHTIVIKHNGQIFYDDFFLGFAKTSSIIIIIIIIIIIFFLFIFFGGGGGRGRYA